MLVVPYRQSFYRVIPLYIIKVLSTERIKIAETKAANNIEMQLSFEAFEKNLTRGGIEWGRNLLNQFMPIPLTHFFSLFCEFVDYDRGQ